MTKTIFEETGGIYTQVGDYLLPNYLANLMTSGKLVAYLDDIEQQATAMFLRLVKELSKKENVTEELKATDQMLWVQKTNNIRNRATEIVNTELIYTV